MNLMTPLRLVLKSEPLGGPTSNCIWELSHGVPAMMQPELCGGDLCHHHKALSNSYHTPPPAGRGHQGSVHLCLSSGLAGEGMGVKEAMLCLSLLQEPRRAV